jgi:hypothetical protein
MESRRKLERKKAETGINRSIENAFNEPQKAEKSDNTTSK